MDLKRLQHLLLLAEERHFGRAAERAFLSQPAFSRSIQALEEDLGLKLFDRGIGDVCPTRAGEFVIERATRLLFDARSLAHDIALYKDSRLGDLAFGTGPFPAAALLHRAVPELRRAFPEVSLRVEVFNWAVLYERLLTEDIEFFVADLRDLPVDPRIEVRELGKLRTEVVVRAGHPFAGRPCTLRELWPCGLATTRLPSAIRDALARLLGLSRLEDFRLAVECDDYSLLKTLALSTDTAVALPATATAPEIAAGQLVSLQVTDLPQFYAETAIVSLSHRTLSPMAHEVIRVLRALL